MATLGNKRSPFPMLGMIGHKGLVLIASEFTTGSAGAISAQPYSGVGGATAVKTNGKTGRYTFTLPSPYKRLFDVGVQLIGPTDAIWGANTVGGPSWFCRNNNVDRGTKAGTIDVQFSASTDNSDAELPSGTIVYVTFWLGTGT